MSAMTVTCLKNVQKVTNSNAKTFQACIFFVCVLCSLQPKELKKTLKSKKCLFFLLGLPSIYTIRPCNSIPFSQNLWLILGFWWNSPTFTDIFDVFSTCHWHFQLRYLCRSHCKENISTSTSPDVLTLSGHHLATTCPPSGHHPLIASLSSIIQIVRSKHSMKFGTLVFPRIEIWNLCNAFLWHYTLPHNNWTFSYSRGSLWGML